MADPAKARKTTADEPADEPAAPKPTANDAERAELARQQAVVDAVRKAGTDELPKLGGELTEPGLGR